jgi:hypothetical protein
MKKLLIVLIIVLSAKSLFADELVRFSVENQRVFGDVYLVDVLAEPLSGSWLVGNCNFILKFNDKALSVADFENDLLMNNDFMTEYSGYKVDQTEYYNNQVSLNIFNLTPQTILKDKQIIGTLRFKILNSAEFDNLKFFAEESEVYNEWKPLEYDLKTIEGYTFQNPDATRLDGLTGVNDSEMNSDILNVTPNPANDKAKAIITLEQAGVCSLALYNTNGKKLMDVFTNENISSKSIEINTSELANGMYILMLSNGNHAYYNKLIVNK